MITFSRIITLTALLGLSSLANASVVNLQGDLNIEGFNPLSGDFNQKTYGLHLTNLSGSVLLDSTPVTNANGTITLDALGSITAPTITNPVLSLINIGLGTLPPSVFGTTFNFGPGFGPSPIVKTASNVTVPVGGINVIFDSVQVTAVNNSIDVLFTESTLFGSGALLLADATIAQITNNSSLTSGFDVQVSTVPVPAAVWFMGSGLLGLLGFSRKKAV